MAKKKQNKQPEQVEVVREFGTYVNSSPFTGFPGAKYAPGFFAGWQLEQLLNSGHLRWVEAVPEPEKPTSEENETWQTADSTQA